MKNLHLRSFAVFAAQDDVKRGLGGQEAERPETQ